MTATLIAEALAHAESATPGHVGNHARGAILDSEGIERGTLAKLWHADEMTIEPGDGVFVRRDVVDAALAHLAERAERAEARATKLRTALDQLSAWFERARTLSLGGKTARSVAMVARNTDDAAKEADRG